MRIGTKILLLMLLITIGSSAIVSWIVTMNVTRYETRRANDQISLAIARYVHHLDGQQQQISRIVRAMLEAPAQRSLLAAAGDPADDAAREQLKQEVLGRDVQIELQSREGTPSFHVLVNLADEVLLVAAKDPALESILSSDEIAWPSQAVFRSKSKPVIQYIQTAAGLFLAMGVPLHTQLDEAPDIAYFVGFRVDDGWVRQQLLAEDSGGGSTSAPLAAWFLVDGRVAAAASPAAAVSPVSSVSSPAPVAAARGFSASTPLRHVDQAAPAVSTGAEHVEFDLAGERYVGQSFKLDPYDERTGRLILASSLDDALAPLRHLQRQILWTGLAACLVAVLACRTIARLIARPIQELVAGTQRIAEGQFDAPLRVRARDELGTLADSFNEMARGLKERDGLREERLKLDRDLALARKIQMDVLPQELPACPGYDMAAFSLPAEQTGGDIYDLIALAPEAHDSAEAPSMVLLLADATGHGIGPAISVTQVRSMLRIGMRLRAGLANILSQINRQLCQDLGSERFVTAFLGVLDPTRHQVDYHSAGQAPLLHFHAQSHRFEWLNSSMLPLGILEEPDDDGARLMQLEPGDLVVLLTDGFYEYANPARELFGQERVAEVILRYHHRPAAELLEELLAATRAFSEGAPQADDMTGVIVRRLPNE